MSRDLRYIIIRDDGQCWGHEGWGTLPIGYADANNAMKARDALGEGKIRLDCYQYPAQKP